MRGTELTESQLASAKQFVIDRKLGSSQVQDNVGISMQFGDLVRIVAWYGALRYQAGAKGINSLDDPGICDVVG